LLESVLKGKIHRAVVTEANMEYEGSIEISRELMDAAGIRPYERVMVANFTNSNRWWTYAIPGEPGEVRLNGGAARLGIAGDIVTIFAFTLVAPEEDFHPKVVLVDGENRVREVLEP
jgi:aspartate 1-decarboxylase